MTLNLRVALAVCCLASLTSMPAVAAPYVYTAGHGDLGVGFHGSELEMHAHFGSGTVINGAPLVGDLEVEADEVLIYVGETALEPRPAAASYDFIGVAAGEDIYKLPQGAIEASLKGLPFLGLATEEIPLGVLQGNVLTLALTGFSGPGHFSMYQSGPTRYLDTADGSFANDSFLFPVGTHDHFNYAFTAPGRYYVELTATGTLLNGEPISGTGVYAFQVVPEPSTVLLALCGGLGLLLALRRRK